MAVVFMEGFDHLSAAQLPSKGWSVVMNIVAGRFGGQAAQVTYSTGTSSRALPGAYSTYIHGQALLLPYAAIETVIALRSGATNVVRLTTVTSGPNVVFRLINASGTVLATGTTPIRASVWYYVEMKVVVHASAGTVELRLNGSSTAECSATGVNTGSSNIDNVLLSAEYYSGMVTQSDDMYGVDTTGSAPTNTWLGEVRVCTLIPNGNGANTAWGGTGTGGFGEWDDITAHDDDTTYVSSSTPGDRETSTLTDLSAATSTVFAVQTNLVARKDDAGTRTIAPVVVIGGTPYDGTTTAALSSSYADYTQLYDRLDPSGATWTASTVNAMETGVKEIA